jgi:hypothetical protein
MRSRGSGREEEGWRAGGGEEGGDEEGRSSIRWEGGERRKSRCGKSSRERVLWEVKERRKRRS